MPFRHFRWWLCTLAALVAAAPAAAQITIDPAVLVIEPGNARDSNIVVANTSEDLVMVTVRPRVVAAPGEADEKIEAQPNPTISGLVATPLRLALEPNERRAVRLMPTNVAGPTDRVWRVQIVPAVGPLRSGQSGIAFIVGYDALVIQRASDPAPRVSGRRDGNILTLTNIGNSFALVTGIEQCQSVGEYVRLPGKRLYAGQSWSVELGQSGPAEVTIEGVGRRVERQSY